MKKLILALAAIGLAAGAQAATFNWKSSANAQGIDATAVTDNGPYAAGTTNMKNKGTWTAILAFYDVSSGALVASSDSLTPKFSSTGSKFNLSNFDVDGLAQGTEYKYVITLSGTQTDLTARGEDTAAGFDYSAAILTTTIEGTITTAAMGDTDFTTAVPSTWQVSGITALSSSSSSSSSSGGDSGVPEPTGGLLLAVGAGVLALRRKRA